MKRFPLYISIALSLCSALSAQNGITGNPDWQIKPAINTGFIVVHRISIGHLVKGYPTIYELNLSKPTLGNKLWHLENNKPDIGITFQCVDYKNPEQLGYALTAAPYIEIPLNVHVKASRLVFRLCWGLSYLTKCFDIATNHKNIAIGSNWNCYTQLKWFWQLPLAKNLRIEPGFAFTHASNGRAVQPNLGLNVLSLNLGLNYLIPSKSKPEVTHIDSSTKAKAKTEILLFAAEGFNQKDIYGKTLKTFVFSAAWQYNKRNTHKFSAGMDFYYDDNYQVDFENQLGHAPKGFDKYRLSARLGYSYNVGRLSFPLEVGYYIFQKAAPDANVVSRVGVRYYSPFGLVAHFGLRTHFAVAYTFEYGLGYRFYIK